MIIVLQLMLYCLIFTLMVRYAVREELSTDCIFILRQFRNVR